MGQKINPIGLRLGINRGWDSTWFAKKKDFGRYLIEDFKIRNYIKKNITNSYYPGSGEVSRPLATRTCETTKIPAGMQKSDFWSFRYASEQKNQKMAKTIKGNDIFSN